MGVGEEVGVAVGKATGVGDEIGVGVATGAGFFMVMPLFHTNFFPD